MTDAGAAPILNVACAPCSAAGQAGIPRLRNSFYWVSPLTTIRLDSAQGGTSLSAPSHRSGVLAYEAPGRFIPAKLRCP